jgi:hypothetical protein
MFILPTIQLNYQQTNFPQKPIKKNIVYTNTFQHPLFTLQILNSPGSQLMQTDTAF